MSGQLISNLFAMNLTDEQLRIINHSGGHARVSAVAGSGKTTTMVARVGQLLQQGVSANLVMVLMFNKSARDSFAEAMQNRLSSAGPLPDVRTFIPLECAWSTVLLNVALFPVTVL